MGMTKVSNVRIAGIAAAVPAQEAGLEEIAQLFGDEDANKINDMTGVRRRRVSDTLCTSDLCLHAAERLLQDLGWERETIGVVIFVSQTPDYIMPATSCVMQNRLGLPTQCAAFDVNLGCSGYVYGLWLASCLMRGSGVSRVLLLAGDTASRAVGPMDRSTKPLFGDAGSATALEFSEHAAEMCFEFGTDGSGAQHLMVPAGGFRQPRSERTCIRTEREGGIIRSDEELHMNGMEVFAFTLKRVPPMVRAVLGKAGWTMAEVDMAVFHQANRFMLQHLAKSIKIPADKLVLGLEEYGNTSSASIPLAIVTERRSELSRETKRVLMAGFGIGLSWCAATVTVGQIIIPELVEVGDAGVAA